MTTSLTIGITTWNKLDLFKTTLSNLFNTTREIQYDLVIVDNASTDATVDYLHQLSTPSNVTDCINIYNTDNLGWGYSINQQMQHAIANSSDYFIHLDNDVLPPQGFASTAIAALVANPHIGMIGVNYEDSQYPIVNGIQLKSCGNLNGGTLVIPKATLSTVGYMYTDVAGGYHGDFLYSMRVRALGKQLAYIAEPGTHCDTPNEASRARFQLGLSAAHQAAQALQAGILPIYKGSY